MGDGKLEELHAEANKTCKLLISVTQFPITLKQRSEILDQRLVENAAHDSYQSARQKLFQAADWEEA